MNFSWLADVTGTTAFGSLVTAKFATKMGVRGGEKGKVGENSKMKRVTEDKEGG